MFGFIGDSPEKRQSKFIDAFQDDKYRGFDLSWIELEILQYATDEIQIADLYDQMLAEYGKEKIGYRSNFYRKVDGLVSKEYLMDTSRDNDDIVNRTIKILDRGYLELGRHSRYFLEQQVKEIFPYIWLDILDKTKEFTGNILNQRICVVTADFNNLSNFETFTAQIFRKHLDVENIDELSGVFYYINFDESSFPSFHNVNVLNSKINDWPLKSDYIDVCFMYNPLSTFGDSDILAEPIRVLKQGGYLVIAELAELESKLASSIFRSFSEMANLIMKSKIWKFPIKLLTIDQIVNEINNFAGTLDWVRDPIVDVINSVFILKKK